MAYLWDARTGQEIRQFSGRHGEVFDVAFSPDGQTLATSSTDLSIRLWDVGTGEQRLVITSTTQVEWFAFSPLGDTILAGGYDGVARLWDAETGELVREFTTSGGGFTAGLAYSPDGHYVFASGLDGILHMWDIQTGAEIRRFVGGEGIMDAEFSPDGRYLLGGDCDDTARLWDFATGRELRRFTGHTGDVQSVAWSPDGRIVVTASWDNTFRLWYVDINDTIADLCARLPRDLTAEEREQYGITDEGPTCPVEVAR
jgi:WD40 repeat protein